MDNDSLLLSSFTTSQSWWVTPPPAFLMEHPEDPANYGTSEIHQHCSSWWATSRCKALCRMWIQAFDQCMLGHPSNKPTEVIPGSGLGRTSLCCAHPKHLQWLSSKALARWGWQMNMEIASAILLYFGSQRNTQPDRQVASSLGGGGNSGTPL